MGRAPQHPLSRPSSFRGVKKSFHLDVMQFFNNVQMKGWSCFPKHGPVPFTVLKNRFVWMLCSHLKTLKLMFGPRCPVLPVTARLISRRWKIVSSWCYADFPQSSNERLVVLHETRFSAFTVLKKFFVWIVWSFSKTFEFKAGPCSSKHGPVPFTVLKNLFDWLLCSRLNTFKLMAEPRSPTTPVTAQLISRLWKMVSSWSDADFQKRSNERMVVLPQTQSRSFHGVEKVFHVDGMKVFKTFQLMAWPCSPKHGPVPSTVLKNFFVWCYAAM